jgi:ABC-type Zn uptake system ZnuABC Zn-binding protein ZnuA
MRPPPALAICGLLAVCCLLAAGEPPRLVATTFPVHQVARNVAGARAPVALLLPAALGCPHHHQLTAHQGVALARADLLIAGGLGLEPFLGRVRAAQPRLAVCELFAGVPAAELLGGHVHGDHIHDANPHLFASPRRLARLAPALAEALAARDADGADAYRAAATAYAARLDALAEALAATVRALPPQRLVVLHDSLDYFAHDVGLAVIATVDADPESGAAAADVIAAVRAARAQGATAVCAEPQFPEAVATTIAREAGLPLLRLDPVASGPEDAAADYYEQAMAANRERLAALAPR